MSINNLDAGELELLNSRTWRLTHSKWRFVVWLSAGILGVFVYIWLAIRVRQLRFVIAAGVSAVIFVVYSIIANQVPKLTPEQQAAAEGTTRVATPIENVMMAAIFVMIAFNIWMSFFLHKPWLVWLVNKEGKKSWVEANLNIKTISPDATRGNFTKLHTDSPVEATVADAAHLIGSSTSSSSSQDASAPPVSPVDVNTASREALGMLPGLSLAQLEALMKERESRKGFRDFGDMSEFLELKPHVALKLEAWCEFSRAPGKSPNGRILDI